VCRVQSLPELFLADALGAVGKPLLRAHTAGSVGGSTFIVGAHLVESRITSGCWPFRGKSIRRATPNGSWLEVGAGALAPTARAAALHMADVGRPVGGGRGNHVSASQPAQQKSHTGLLGSIRCSRATLVAPTIGPKRLLEQA
jgi:hypothetical protein